MSNGRPTTSGDRVRDYQGEAACIQQIGGNDEGALKVAVQSADVLGRRKAGVTMQATLGGSMLDVKLITRVCYHLGDGSGTPSGRVWRTLGRAAKLLVRSATCQWV